MSIFDLLFILLFLGSVCVVFGISINMLPGRKAAAKHSARVLGIVLGTYLSIIVFVDIVTPQKVLNGEQERCLDDMCFAVTSVKTATHIGIGAGQKARGIFYVVTIRVSCNGHGRAQSEGGVGVSCVDSKGHKFELSSDGQRAFDVENGTNPPLTARVPAGESVSSVQVFDLPLDASGIGLQISHSGPGIFIIGDDESPLHRPTIIRLAP